MDKRNYLNNVKLTNILMLYKYMGKEPERVKVINM